MSIAADKLAKGIDWWSLPSRLYQSLYRQPPSLGAYLPYADYERRDNHILLEDGRSVAAVIELEPVSCEARPESFLQQLQEKLHTALLHALPEQNPPWVLQLFLQRESMSGEWQQKMHDYVELQCKDTAFTMQYLQLLGDHLRAIDNPAGYFDDQLVSGGNWHGTSHKIRGVIYRRIPQYYRSDIGLTPAQELKVAMDRLMESLRAAGVTATQLSCDEFHRWMVNWFNPNPAVEGPNRLEEWLTGPSASTEQPFGARLIERMLLGATQSNADDGLWYFDDWPHCVVTLQQFLKSPVIGHLSAERAQGSRHLSLWDRFPVGSVLSITIVAKSQDQIIDQLEIIEKRAVGGSAEARRAQQEVTQARTQIASGTKLYPAAMCVFLRSADIEELRRGEDKVNALLLAEGLKPITRESDQIRLDAYLRQLPCNFDPHFDQHAHWARLNYSTHLASLLPLYGRSRGTGNPGYIGFNRGGEPFTFDPLNHNDRRKNGHGLIIGPPGSGKSSYLLAWLTHQLAVRRPRIFLTEVGRSFDLFAQYLTANGISVNRVMLTPGEDVTLPLYHDAIHLRAIDLPNDNDMDEEVGDPLERDILSELEVTSSLMVTGGEAREVDRLHRADRRILHRAILQAGEKARARDEKTVLTQHIAQELKRLDGLEPTRQARAAEMADCLELYTEGFAGHVFNRAGHPWPDVDVTILNVGTFANEGNEDKLALAVIGLVNYVNSMAEKTRYEDRQILLCFDEAHIVTTHPLLAPYLTKASKVWGRRYAVWLWLATQNMEDFPDNARRLLNTLEWWLALFMPPKEIEQLARFRELTDEQKTLLSAVTKEPGKYTEAVLLHDEMVALFRNVPPPLMLALAQTEQHERVNRRKIMEQLGCTELEAVHHIAEHITQSRISANQGQVA